METFWTIRKISRLSGNFPGYPETFQAIQKLSRLSKNFLDYKYSFRIIQKISSLSRNFPGYPEIFRIIRKISSLSGNFPGYPEIFRIIRKISSLSGNYLKGLETSQCNFKGYAQKLSRRAKTFQMAMPIRRRGFWASALALIRNMNWFEKVWSWTCLCASPVPHGDIHRVSSVVQAVLAQLLHKGQYT